MLLASLLDHPLDFFGPDSKAFFRSNAFGFQTRQFRLGALCLLHSRRKRFYRDIPLRLKRLLLLQELPDALVRKALAPRVLLASLLDHPLDFLGPEPKAFFRSDAFGFQTRHLRPGVIHLLRLGCK